MDGQIDRQADIQTDGQMDGRTDGRMDGWTDGQMDVAYCRTAVIVTVKNHQGKLFTPLLFISAPIAE